MIIDVTIRCDRTGETVSTGIELDPVTFKSLPDIPALLPCLRRAARMDAIRAYPTWTSQ